MLKNVFSKESTDKLLATPSTLCVLPLSGQCRISTPGVIETGLAGFGRQAINEVWLAEGESVIKGQFQNLFWSKTSDIICISIWLDLDINSPIELVVNDAYTSLITYMKKAGYPHPLRFWNYLPKINSGEGDSEVYKRFCTGRLTAFNNLDISPEQFPAASALGHNANGAVIFAFAGKTPALNFKNNMQVNAYDYPRIYGLSSPSFARASAVMLGQYSNLFISGTASIIGHETVALDDLSGQMETTLSNIEHLLRTSNPHQTRLASMKVYLRHQAHYSDAKKWLDHHYPDVPIVYTHADVCRANLLVEIECFCQ